MASSLTVLQPSASCIGLHALPFLPSPCELCAALYLRERESAILRVGSNKIQNHVATKGWSCCRQINALEMPSTTLLLPRRSPLRTQPPPPPPTLTPPPPRPEIFSDGVMQKWVSLEVPAAYGVSLLDDTVAAACANGLVRLFQASDLRYTATLPRPPPLGHANVASIRELRDITASAAPTTVTTASDGKEAELTESFSSAAGVESRQDGNEVPGGEREKEQRRDSGGGAIGGGGAAGGLLRCVRVLDR